MKVNGTRLMDDLHYLRQFTDTPGKGVTRFSYGESDKKAREYLLLQARSIGCRIIIDPLRNVRILMPQNQEQGRKVVIGSHIDTVKNGGWLDGVYGVAAGMEVMRVLKDSKMEKIWSW